MKISYDSETDSLYIRILEGKHECINQLLSDEVTLNIGENGILVGIEILDAKQTLGGGEILPITLENIPFVTTA